MFNINSLSSLRESNQLEAKAASNGTPRSMWETYCAFANTNGGTILLGVGEDAQHNLQLVGVNNPEHMVKDIWDTLNNKNKISSNILIEENISIEQMDDNKSIIRITVPRANRSDKPIYINGNPIGGMYRRNFEGNYKCSQEEYQAMVRDNGSSVNSMDQSPLLQHSVDDFDMETVRSYRNMLSAVRPQHPWLTLDADEFLMRIGALAKDESNKLHPTRAGLLMFGHEWCILTEFPYYFLDYREITSTDSRWSHRIVSSDGSWSGNLYDFWSIVWQRLSRKIDVPFLLNSQSLRVDDTPLHMAVREALANTLIHADYYMRGNTVITYDDAVSTDVDGSSQSSIETNSANDGFKLSFANPGCLRMPVEVALAGGFSDSRNPALLKMFALISVVERAGSGFDAMRAGCDWAGIRYPMLSESFNPDRTTLEFFVSDKNNFISGSSKNKTELNANSLNLVNGTYNSELTTNSLSQDSNNSHKRMSVDDCYKKIIEAVHNHGTIKREQVQNILNVGSTKAKQLLSDLVSRGDISVCGKGRATTYVFNRS